MHYLKLFRQFPCNVVRSTDYGFFLYPDEIERNMLTCDQEAFVSFGGDFVYESLTGRTDSTRVNAHDCYGR